MWAAVPALVARLLAQMRVARAGRSHLVGANCRAAGALVLAAVLVCARPGRERSRAAPAARIPAALAAGAAAGRSRLSALPCGAASLRGCAGCSAGDTRSACGACFVGVTTLTTGAGVAGSRVSALRAVSSSGLPGFAASCGCWAAKPACATGGALTATTGRSNTRAGGVSRCAAAPRTLFSVGAKGGAMATGALATSSFGARSAALDTGCDCTNAVVGTAITAPATCRLA